MDKVFMINQVKSEPFGCQCQVGVIGQIWRVKV